MKTSDVFISERPDTNDKDTVILCILVSYQIACAFQYYSAFLISHFSQTIATVIIGTVPAKYKK